MRYSDMRDMRHELSGLLAKKRTGKNQKARIADLSTLLTEAETYHQPPETPPCVNTGERGDYQGNTYANHYQMSVTMRVMRRGKRFGLSQCQPMRSRIQRTKRKQRTGGTK